MTPTLKKPSGQETRPSNKPKLLEGQTSSLQTPKRPRSSPSNNKQRQKLTKLDYWLNPNPEMSTTNSNRFSILSDDENKEDNHEKVVHPKPPPLFVAGVKDINPLTTLLREIASNEYTLKIINSEEVKIQCTSIDSYDLVVKELKIKNTEFHSYQKKEDRPYKVVLKNMHSSTDIELIKEELKTHGHFVIKIINILSRTNRAPLPMFFIDLKIAANNKDVYKIEFLLNTRVNFEPPKKKRDIPQCLRCQRFGHTKNFCSRQPRCVKCAENHPTFSCPTKERTNNVKCVHCGGQHPASYKGCAVYKELQKSKYPALRKKENPINHRPQYNQQPITIPGMTYAQATKLNGKEPAQGDIELNQPSNQSDIAELKHMMKTLMEQMSTMLNLLTTIVTKSCNV